MRSMSLMIAFVLVASVAVSCGGSQVKKDEDVTAKTTSATRLDYPETRREEIMETLHGQRVADPYRWLEDEDDEKVQAWMASQDDLTRGFLKKLPGRDRLKKRFSELYYIDKITAPKRRGERYFYARRHADKEKWIYYWKEGEDGEENVLLDPNELSEDGSISVGLVKASWDGRKAAYTLKENNADEATLYVMDVDTGETSEKDVIPGAKYARPEWTPDSSGFYYTHLPTDPDIPTADRPGHSRIRYHELGTDPAKDPVIKEKTGDPKLFLGVDLSRDGRWLFYYVWHGWNASDVYYRDLESDREGWTKLVEGEPHRYYVNVWKDQFYIVTDEGAPRERVFKVHGEKAANRDAWKEVIPEFEDGSVIDGVEVVGEHLVLTLLRNAHSDMRIFDLDGELVRDIELPGIGATFGMTGNPEDDKAYFGFESFIVPDRIYETSISTGETDLWAEIDVPIDSKPYDVEQVWYPSKDGTRISMFIVRKKGAPKDGETPTLLYGYGGFNISMRPYFRAGYFPWLEAGGAYAIPNLRGGGEYGEEWHEAGMLENKQNVFDDFIAAAEYLVENGYTNPDKLVIKGGSNGGLLVGAAMTQRPDLFEAVVCAVPLLDMVRYHLFGSGKTWISEYGTAEKKEQFEYLYAYSPYHHVENGTAYPATLILSADSDDRVDPMHARKFAAALQYAADGSGEPMLLRIETKAGHGGADLVRKYVEKDADTFAFLMHRVGLDPSAVKLH